MLRYANRSCNVRESKEREKISFLPSQFSEGFLKMPGKGGLTPYSLRERPYFYAPYNTSAKAVLLKTGRQTGKSTLLANRILTFSALEPFFRSLYVSPTNTQTTQFSNDRIRSGILYSKFLRIWENREHVRKILHKAFHNGAEILLKYAFYNADRIRGNTADLVAADEIQDMIWELIPVIEETLFTSSFGYRIYSGTPKSTSNTLEHYWRQSTQCEWMVPCDHCGTSRAKGGAGRMWNILGEPNISREGVVCAKCKKPIDPRHQDAHWELMNPNPRDAGGRSIEIPFYGFHISQLMHPMSEEKWIELWNKYRNNPRGVFFNEVLGLSYDSGLRPLTPAHIKFCCDHRITMAETGFSDYPYGLAYFEKHCRAGAPCYMGVDWGVGSGRKGTYNTYTVVTLMTYVEHRLVVFYAHRLLGEDSEPARQIALISELINRFRPRFVGADYGGGHDRNDALIRSFGPDRVFEYQYATINKKARWDGDLKRFLVNRTDVMTDVFNAIKRGDVFTFPRWEEWERPYSEDCLNIFGEYNDHIHRIQYNLTPGTTDDTFHSILYALLASTIHRKRPDIFVPVSRALETKLRKKVSGPTPLRVARSWSDVPIIGEGEMPDREDFFGGEPPT